MTPTEYRAALSRLGLSQAGAGALFGVADRTSRRWALDEAAIPDAVAKLLRLALAGKISVEDIRGA